MRRARARGRPLTCTVKGTRSAVVYPMCHPSACVPSTTSPPPAAAAGVEGLAKELEGGAGRSGGGRLSLSVCGGGSTASRILLGVKVARNCSGRSGLGLGLGVGVGVGVGEGLGLGLGFSRRLIEQE